MLKFKSVGEKKVWLTE